MRSRLLALAPLLAAGGLPAPAAAADLGHVTFATVKDRRAGVTPAGSAASRRLPVSAVAFGKGAGLRTRGSLALRGSGRTVRVTSLRLSLGRTPLRLSGLLAGRRVTFATIVPRKGAPLRTDPRAGTVRLSRATLSLTRTGAAALRRPLRRRTAPRTGRLGTVTLVVAPPADPLAVTPEPIPVPPVAPAADVPTPAPPTPAATPTPTPTATPAPTPTPAPAPIPDPCWAARPATPPDVADWIACDSAGGSLKSFTNYLRTDWSAAGACVAGRHGVYPSLGATLIEPGNPHDHRLAVAATTHLPGGGVELALGGTLEYALDAHGIDQATVDPVITLDAARTIGTVRVDGRSSSGGPSSSCPTTPEPFADVDALELHLDAATHVATSPAGTTFTHVPATLTTAGAARLGAGFYPAGSAWGSFTFTVPAP